jgi:hypothetical protein
VATGFRLTLRKSDQLQKPIDHLKGVLVLSDDRAYFIDAPFAKSGESKNSSAIGIHPAQSREEGPRK